MPQGIRSILGKRSRVTKPSQPKPTSSPSKSASASSPRKAARKPREVPEELFPDKLDDEGLATLLTTELTLRDAVQAMRYIRSHMFTPVPTSGFNSTRTAELLNYRLGVPPIVTTGHLNAILNSPTRVEKEVAELNRKGILRKVRVERRGGIGHALIESSDLEDMVWKTPSLSKDTQDSFIAFLTQNPVAQDLPQDALSAQELRELQSEGYIVTRMQARPGSTLHVRPEDRTTLTSIQRVSQAASGSVAAVGGSNAIHLSGGGGGSGSRGASTVRNDGMSYRIAIPGHGRYLKLAEAALDWLRDTLARTKWGEGPEGWLKERFEGGGLYGPRWKDFEGLEWDWLLGEAVGLGVIELFDTASVGRGIRASGS
ncbi:hypothetical protein NLU13_2095 [Sarocladium strictum]|uniref:Serine-threonine protein kinase 19 n=1 Tax=Sarocladium strictum TaxID=5046 RepID=A0AA39LCZ3_SARSR|nr:hypothetical protein NLU13_2095 [Sarocladium strictum]